MEFKILKFIFGWSSVRVQCFAFESYLNHFLFCSSLWTNLDVTYVITQKDHIESCPVDEHLAYRMEKRRSFRRVRRANYIWSFSAFYVGKVHDVQPPVLKLPELNEPKAA
ncbi:hypothetical protein T09_4853 [Trichinella sp. T9]|nr:hypothetical protein T09_4853 [Trichinella sp. T9]